ncbi:MAG: hypothetical protein M3Q42_14475 [Pseudomonadota bacterium]|nr:hypothetical protein [Pseudomonadota bacterium]
MSSQKKSNKAAKLDVVAIPNALPHNQGVVRVERMHNQWMFAPLANGEVESA